MAQALAPVASRVEKELGLALGLRARVTVGQFDTRLPVALGTGRFLDARGRLLPAGQAPPALRTAFARLLAGSAFALEANQPTLSLRYRPRAADTVNDSETARLGPAASARGACARQPRPDTAL